MKGDARVPYPFGRCQSITTGAASARTASGVSDQVKKVMIYSSQDAYYTLGGSTVVATSSAGTFIPAGGEHFIEVRMGQYVAAIQDSAAGVVKVSEFCY